MTRRRELRCRRATLKGVKVFSNAEVRAWARDNGYEVADRGRIPMAVVAA